MKIRTARFSDLEAVTALEAACFPPSQAATKESFARRLEAFADHFWLLEEEGELVALVDGMVTDTPDLLDEMYENAQLHQPDGKWQMIFGVITHPDWRRKGLMEQLLNRVIKDAEQQGRKGLVLTCLPHMLHYYEKFGFVNEGLSASNHGGVAWYQMRLTFPQQGESL